MAKFTVYFKDKAIQSKIFDSGVIHIGRDDTNDLSIDNLAVAQVHAVVIIKENACIIKQLNDEYPLIINNEAIKETLLQNNDKLLIGKHTILFNTTESITQTKNTSADKETNTPEDKSKEKTKTPDANLQVMDGPHIGRLLPLKKSMTRFGHSGSGVVIISRRKEGYFISTLEGETNISINKKPLGNNTINLNHNDIVVIDNISMQFFLDT